jgi:hypothetical protein
MHGRLVDFKPSSASAGIIQRGLTKRDVALKTIYLDKRRVVE